MTKHACLLLCAAAILTLPACGSVVGPSQNIFSEFTGVLEPLGDTESFEFQVSRNGEFDVRITALEPSAGVFVQVLMGQFVGGACSQIVGLNFGGLNTIALSGAITTGRYCVGLFDEGFLTGPVSFTLRVSHP